MPYGRSLRDQHAQQCTRLLPYKHRPLLLLPRHHLRRLRLDPRYAGVNPT